MATATLSGATYTPRKPAKRGEVKSRTPLHLRERVALIRCWLFDHPKTVVFALGLALSPTVEHYKTTFPWIAGRAVGAWHIVTGIGHVLAVFGSAIGIG